MLKCVKDVQIDGKTLAIAGKTYNELPDKGQPDEIVIHGEYDALVIEGELDFSDHFVRK